MITGIFKIVFIIIDNSNLIRRAGSCARLDFDLTIRPWQLDIIQRNRTLWIKLQLTVMIDGYSNDSVIRQCFNTKLKHTTNSVLVHVM